MFLSHMILPIHIYGAPALTAGTDPVTSDSPELQTLIDDMIETMHGALGIGLAAPQVGRRERLFVVDLSSLEVEGEQLPSEPMVFINPEIIEESPEDEEFEEGCLSIPEIREYVVRPEGIRVAALPVGTVMDPQAITGAIAEDVLALHRGLRVEVAEAAAAGGGAVIRLDGAVDAVLTLRVHNPAARRRSPTTSRTCRV